MNAREALAVLRVTVVPRAVVGNPNFTRFWYPPQSVTDNLFDGGGKEVSETALLPYDYNWKSYHLIKYVFHNFNLFFVKITFYFVQTVFVVEFLDADGFPA